MASKLYKILRILEISLDGSASFGYNCSTVNRQKITLLKITEPIAPNKTSNKLKQLSIDNHTIIGHFEKTQS